MADSQRKTANLFDLNATNTNNGYIDSSYLLETGEINTSTGYFISEYIPVLAGTTYTLLYNTSKLNNPSMAFYDSNKDFLSGIKYSNVLPITFTAPSNTVYIRISGIKSRKSSIMLNEGSMALPYEPYWKHSLRKLTTATEAVENPLYADGTAITAYTIKGNTVQSGTPSPSNPVAVNGVGERTENLFNVATATVGYFVRAGNPSESKPIGYIERNQDYNTSDYIKVEPDTTYSIKYTAYNSVTGAGLVFYSDNSGTVISGTPLINQSITYTFTTPINCNYVRFSYLNTQGNNEMFNLGQPKDYEPYGYKIPISSAGQTTPVYLGEVQSTRQIQKLVLTGQENWTYDDTYTRFVITISGITRYGTRDTPFYCTHYQVISDGRPIADVPNNATYLVATVTDTATLNIKTDSYTSADDFKAFLSNQYANGTPVTVYYVLVTATTGIVNEPLMKIDTYADSISNATTIPTIEGANSITVDTTVQPSEFTATWTGWHDSSVKEYDGTDWQ